MSVEVNTTTKERILITAHEMRVGLLYSSIRSPYYLYTKVEEFCNPLNVNIVYFGKYNTIGTLKRPPTQEFYLADASASVTISNN